MAFTAGQQALEGGRAAAEAVYRNLAAALAGPPPAPEPQGVLEAGWAAAEALYRNLSGAAPPPAEPEGLTVTRGGVALWGFLLVLSLWLKLVSQLRWMQYDRVKKLDPRQHRQQIVYQTASREFPFIGRVSLEMALFRTYAIPSISRILAGTRQFKDQCVKRYDDTDFLLREIIENSLEGARGQAALRRMNFIHSHYTITNEDFLFVLSVFMTEPEKFTRLYEWRKLNQTEKDGLYYFWREIGEGMGIKDIPESYEAMKRWSDAYEEAFMVYAKSNPAVGDPTVDMLLDMVPSFTRGLVRPAIYCLMDERLLDAMGYAHPPAWLRAVVVGAMRVRARFIQYCMLPRLPRQRERRTPEGELHPEKDAPFQMEWSVYGVTYPNGYKIGDLGPDHIKKGKFCPMFPNGSTFGGQTDGAGGAAKCPGRCC